MPHLSPTTLTTNEQRLVLRATAGNVRDHLAYSMAVWSNNSIGDQRFVMLPRY